jgi:amidase
VVASADLAVAAVGTETDGSIVCPSGANGVVGIKPTIGLWSRSGIIPISADQDTAGPMARNVTDAAVLLGAATGIDPNDPATSNQAGNAFSDYTQFLDDEALEGARIGVWREGTYGPSMAANVEPILADTIAALEGEGATVVDPADIDLSGAAQEFPALLCEFKTDIATYLQTRRSRPARTPSPAVSIRRPSPISSPSTSRTPRSKARGTTPCSTSPRRRTAATRRAPSSGRRPRRPSRPPSRRSWRSTTSTRSSR